MIGQPRIYFSLRGLYFNDLNSLKLNHVHKMPIQTTGVCFKFQRLVIFNYYSITKI